MKNQKNKNITMLKNKKNTYPYKSEILFLYDIFRCNPNGDPFENRPREDPLTGRIDITDVRLKRTIRDYILNYKHEEKKDDGLEIFVRVVGENALTAENRYKELFSKLPTIDAIKEAKELLIRKCIDVRMFGGLVPITKKSNDKDKKEGIYSKSKGGGIQLTGAVQFNMGQSLHAVDIIEVAGTGGFSSKEDNKRKTFRSEFIVPYALLGFYGVINNNVAKESGLTMIDVNILMEAMWNGTLFLHSRSKAFHHPRLLLRFDFNNDVQCGYFLDKLEFKSELDGRKIRSPKDYDLNLKPIFDEVVKQKDNLQNIYCLLDSSFILSSEELTENLKAICNNKTKKFEIINSPNFRGK